MVVILFEFHDADHNYSVNLVHKNSIMKYCCAVLFFMAIQLDLFSQIMITSFGNAQRRAQKKMRNEAIAKAQEEGNVKFKSHTVSGLKLTNDGYGGFVEYAKFQNAKWGWLFQLDISERKHIKEEKLQNDYSPTAPVIYGKINFFYPVKLGAQRHMNLGNKGNRNGVSISANVGGGLSLAVLRPYLVEVEKANGEFAFVGFNSPDSGYFRNGPIIGGPSLSNGWNQISVKPGLYSKAAVRFDYGKLNEMVNAIEFGGYIEFYPNRIEQMIDIKQHQLFLGAYVGIALGRRK
jgi:hypothetical protein